MADREARALEVCDEGMLGVESARRPSQRCVAVAERRALGALPAPWIRHDRLAKSRAAHRRPGATLSVLGFKRSFFAGVLDGGESDVFLGGSRLKRFMDSVENVTGGIPAPTVEEPGEPAAAEPLPADESVNGEDDEAVAPAAMPSPADPLSSLLRTGLDLLTHFASAAGTGQTSAGATPSRLFERIHDERSGQSYLKIRMPEPEVVDRVAQALQALLESFRR